MQQIVETSARRIIRLCTKRGLLDDTAADRLAAEEPVLAVPTAASVRGLIATEARAGQRFRRALQDPATGVRTASLCFASRGFSLHAANAGRGLGPAGIRTLMPLRGPIGPGRRALAPSRFATAFLRAQNAVVGWGGRSLLARVLGADLSACAACGGRLRIIAALTDSASIRIYLKGIGLPAVPPPRAPPPQFEFVA